MWLKLLGLTLLGFTAEYLAERWGIQHSNLSNAHCKVSRETFAKRVLRVQRLAVQLFALGLVDTGSVLGGVAAFSAVSVGSAMGVWIGTEKAMWKRWTDRNEPEE